jgi:hypothetical protein
MASGHPVLTTAIQQTSDCLLVLRILEERPALHVTMEAILPALIAETIAALQALLPHITTEG